MMNFLKLLTYSKRRSRRKPTIKFVDIEIGLSQPFLLAKVAKRLFLIIEDVILIVRYANDRSAMFSNVSQAIVLY